MRKLGIDQKSPYALLLHISILHLLLHSKCKPSPLAQYQVQSYDKQLPTTYYAVKPVREKNGYKEDIYALPFGELCGCSVAQTGHASLFQYWRATFNAVICRTLNT